MSIFLKKSLAVYFSTYSSEEFKSGSDNSNVIWVAMNFVFIAVSYSWHVKSQVPMSTLEKKKKKLRMPPCICICGVHYYPVVISSRLKTLHVPMPRNGLDPLTILTIHKTGFV